MKKDVHDYLQQGMFGPREQLPDERRQYLGTLRERVLVALTQGQVRKPGTYEEIQDLLVKHPTVKMFLNGNMDYSSLSDYIKLANKHDILYSMTVNQEHNSEIGLLLAYGEAIDKEEIMITETEKDDPEVKGIKKFFSDLFQSDK
jgi:uncharacterized protein YueI